MGMCVYIYIYIYISIYLYGLAGMEKNMETNPSRNGR